MEHTSENSILKKFGRKEDFSIYESVVRRYAQEQQQLDPTQLQVGQSVYDASGLEYRVVENPEGTTSKVLMPTQQQDPNNPTVQTVEDSELASQYSMQPEGEQATVTAGRRAQEDVDWGEIQSVAMDLLAYSRRENLREVTSAVEELTNLLLSHMEVPEGFFDKASSVLPEFRKVTLRKFKSHKVKKSGQYMPETSVFPDVRGNDEEAENDPKLTTNLKNEDKFNIGQTGYVDIMNEIKDLIKEGYPTVDVVLKIGENYPREQGEMVLAEARKQGIL